LDSIRRIHFVKFIAIFDHVLQVFTKATQVIDRFHVQKLAYDAVQEMRIAYRWQAIEQENNEIEISKELGETYLPNKLSNGDTHKQLLARSRYLLFKPKSKWTPSQVWRAELLFKYYPELERAYELAQKLGHIYHQVKDKGVAFTKLAHWYDIVEKAAFKSFNTIAKSIQGHYITILNYFERRSTNASAESFNAKIKAFRSQFRGVRNVPFFLYRLSMIMLSPQLFRLIPFCLTGEPEKLIFLTPVLNTNLQKQKSHPVKLT